MATQTLERSFRPKPDVFIALKPYDDKTAAKTYATKEGISPEEGTLLVHDRVPCNVKLVSKTRAFNNYCEDLDRILKIGIGSSTVFQAHRALTGQLPSESCGRALNTFQVTAGMLGIVRVIPATIQLGNFFWTDTGKTRSALDVIVDIIFLVMRWLSPINWLHKIKAIDLGKHAAHMGAAISSCIAAGVTLSFVSAIKDYIQEKKLDQLPQKLANLISGFFDMLSLPFDIGLLLNIPIMAIVGGILMGVSGIVYLITQLMDHKVPVPATTSRLYAAAAAA